MKKRAVAFLLTIFFFVSLQSEYRAFALQSSEPEEIKTEFGAEKTSGGGYRVSQISIFSEVLVRPMPSTGKIKIPVLAIDFSDHRENDEELYRALEKKYNAELDVDKASVEGPFTQSVHAAFQALSYGRLDLTADTFVYHAENPGSYYSTESMVRELMKSALEHCISTGDLVPTDYDSDKDGWVDGFLVEFYYEPISPPYNGGSGGWTGTFTRRGIVSLSAVMVDGFWAFSAVFSKVTSTIVHEILHMMGLPDHYGYSDHRK